MSRLPTQFLGASFAQPTNQRFPYVMPLSIANHYRPSYESLPPNFSLLQNMMAGAFAGIAVRVLKQPPSKRWSDIAGKLTLATGAHCHVPSRRNQGSYISNLTSPSPPSLTCDNNLDPHASPQSECDDRLHWSSTKHVPNSLSRGCFEPMARNVQRHCWSW